MSKLKDSEKEFNSKVGQKIKFWREQKLLTQSELADKLGVSRSSLAYIETGKSNITLFFVFQLKLILNFDDNFYKELFDLIKSSQSITFKSNSEELKKDSDIINSILDSL